MMVTVQELRSELNKYFEMAKKEPVIILLDDQTTLVLMDSVKYDRVKEMNTRNRRDC